MRSETSFTRPKGLEELNNEIYVIKSVIQDLMREINYALRIIRRALESENMLSYEQSYDLRKTQEEITKLARELEDSRGDP